MKVIYAATRNLYPFMLPSIMSLLEHNSVEKIYLMIEDNEMPYAVPHICECVNVRTQMYFPEDGANYHSLFTYMGMMCATYADLFWDEDKLIQLDADTIVCDDLTPLWEMDLTGKWFGAVPEYKSEYRPFGSKYYNIGVCVYNLKQMRMDDIVPTMVDWLNKTPALCGAQDAMNWFGVHNEDKAVEIPIRYNESIVTGTTDNPAVVHFAGYTDWINNRSMPRVEYLDKYRHLYVENENCPIVEIIRKGIEQIVAYINECEASGVRRNVSELTISPSVAKGMLPVLRDRLAEMERRV